MYTFRCKQKTKEGEDEAITQLYAASRIGKGTHFAMNRLNKFMHDYYTNYGSAGYILKYDIRKYYDSIDHEILYKLMEKLFSDEPEILRLIRVFIDSYEVQPEKGLPLGNQSSQWFALYYLDGLDRLSLLSYRWRQGSEEAQDVQQEENEEET